MSARPRSNGADGAPAKSVLYCPECGHESLASGDWVVQQRDDHAVYACPECGAEIATRGTDRCACCV